MNTLSNLRFNNLYSLGYDFKDSVKENLIVILIILFVLVEQI